MTKDSSLKRFEDRLLAYFTGARADIATRDVNRYIGLETFTGRLFEELANTEEPNRITAKDLVAVTALGVVVPPKCAFWILNDGGPAISRLLEQLPADIDIWEADDTTFAIAEELWALLNTADWPQPGSGANGMGRTIKSKLLAAKRPRLLPVLDSVVCEALGERADFWSAFRYALRTPESRLLTSVRVVPRGDLSLLRAIDIVVWMANRHPQPGDPPLPRQDR